MHPLTDIRDDLRYALRTLRREPTFVAGVVLTFALAIGTNAAMFGLVKRLMLAPPPGIHDAARVVRVQVGFAREGEEPFSMATMSYPVFRAIATQDKAFMGVAAVRPDTMRVGRGADVAQVSSVKASGNYFTVLETRPAIGRFFGPADDELPDGNPVVVLSHAYWRTHFGAAVSAIGRQMVLDDQRYTIIGVAPRDFNGDQLSAVDVFVPLTAASRGQGSGWWNRPGVLFASVVARLRDAVDPKVAAAIATSGIRGDATEHVSSIALEPVVPGQAARQSPQAKIALWLSGVSIVVLLIATANVGTLLLLRTAKRRRDVVVRIALGASQGRLTRQLLVESVLLALLGAAVGLVLARWFSGLVRLTLLPNLASTDAFVDRSVLMVSIAAATTAGLLAGLTPLAQLARRNLASDLRTGGGGASSRFVFQNVLVAIQVALCTVLIVGASLFVHSLQRVQSQDLGFSTAHLLYATLDFRGRVPGADRDLAHAEAARRLEHVAGIDAVTLVEGMPFSSHHIPPISIPGVPSFLASGVQPPIMYAATPAYLSMMNVQLRAGRLFDARDGRGTPLVALVNESMARAVWPNGSAIGKCIRINYPASFDDDPDAAAAQGPCRQVVGVVKDSRARSLRLEGNEGKIMQYYLPLEQSPAPPAPNYAAIHGILIQTSDPSRLAPTVQRAIQSTSTLPVFARVHPYQELIDPQLRSWRLGATLFTAFGALALGIAAVGLFGVVSYLVTQRTQEIGVRLALGGTRLTVSRLVVGDAVRMAAMGAVAGLVVAMTAAPLMQSLLFQTSAREPLSALAAAIILLGVAVAAAALPAWRASQVNPIVALRIDC